jgi:hypothetical protein
VNLTGTVGLSYSRLLWLCNNRLFSGDPRLLGLVSGYNVSSVRCRTDGLHTSVFGAVVGTGNNNAAMELAADFNAVFFDGSLGANLHNTVFGDFNQIGCGYFFKRHDVSLFPATASTVTLRVPVIRTGTN